MRWRAGTASGRRHVDAHGHRRARTEDAARRRREWHDAAAVGRQARDRGVVPAAGTIDAANDDFIRTTQHATRRGCSIRPGPVRQRLDLRGQVRGAYCVGCEEFKPGPRSSRHRPLEGLKVCAIHSIPLELLQEKNYFFKLSEFQDRLLELYSSDPDFVRPESARNEVVSFVRSGLKDLSISRSAFDWGIRVPWDDTHVIYVWVDALLNYATASGTAPIRGVRAPLAGVPPRGQGHPALPRRHLAGDADGRGRRCAERRVRARLAAGRRREDVEVQADGNRAERDHGRIRLGRLPLLLPLRHRVRSGRVVLVGGPLGALPGRTRERLRQPGLAHDGDDRALLRGHRACPPGRMPRAISSFSASSRMR